MTCTGCRRTWRGRTRRCSHPRTAPPIPQIQPHAQLRNPPVAALPSFLLGSSGFRVGRRAGTGLNPLPSLATIPDRSSRSRVRTARRRLVCCRSSTIRQHRLPRAASQSTPRRSVRRPSQRSPSATQRTLSRGTDIPTHYKPGRAKKVNILEHFVSRPRLTPGTKRSRRPHSRPAPARTSATESAP